MNVPVLAEDGAKAGEVALLDEIFAAPSRPSLVHQVVTAQLAAARRGTHHTKTRGEVRGGGRKPWRQKGTGRARHGSIREPQWVGGGIAHGARTRDHAQKIPKKMKATALRSALSDRARDGRVLVVEDLSFEEPKTKRAIKALEAWETSGRVLLVLPKGADLVAASFHNLPEARCITQDQLNTYDVLRASSVIFLRSALDVFQERSAALPGRPTGEETGRETVGAGVGASEAKASEKGDGAGSPGPASSQASETDEGGDER